MNKTKVEVAGRDGTAELVHLPRGQRFEVSVEVFDRRGDRVMLGRDSVLVRYFDEQRTGPEAESTIWVVELPMLVSGTLRVEFAGEVTKIKILTAALGWLWICATVVLSILAALAWAALAAFTRLDGSLETYGEALLRFVEFAAGGLSTIFALNSLKTAIAARSFTPLMKARRWLVGVAVAVLVGIFWLRRDNIWENRTGEKLTLEGVEDWAPHGLRLFWKADNRFARPLCVRKTDGTDPACTLLRAEDDHDAEERMHETILSRTAVGCSTWWSTDIKGLHAVASKACHHVKLTRDDDPEGVTVELEFVRHRASSGLALRGNCVSTLKGSEECHGSVFVKSDSSVTVSLTPKSRERLVESITFMTATFTVGRELLGKSFTATLRRADLDTGGDLGTLDCSADENRDVDLIVSRSEVDLVDELRLSRDGAAFSSWASAAGGSVVAWCITTKSKDRATTADVRLGKGWHFENDWQLALPQAVGQAVVHSANDVRLGLASAGNSAETALTSQHFGTGCSKLPNDIWEEARSDTGERKAAPIWTREHPGDPGAGWFFVFATPMEQRANAQYYTDLGSCKNLEVSCDGKRCTCLEPTCYFDSYGRHLAGRGHDCKPVPRDALTTTIASVPPCCGKELQLCR